MKMAGKMVGVALVAFLGLGALAGCQTPPPRTAAGVGDKAVMCPMCQVVWVETPRQVGKNITTFAREQKMVCPDCTSAVANFFKTGKLKHACKTCGENLIACPLCK